MPEPVPDEPRRQDLYAWANLERPLFTSLWFGVAAGLLVAGLIVIGLVGEHLDTDLSYAVVPLVAAVVALSAMTIMYVILVLCSLALRLLERQGSPRRPNSRRKR
ncbi:hypothetical protein [Brachybacterium tyrofermentans]|uniref:hypothetical protein n=1 Tax=Brachybacterium tyrofermentans TaxID=47848 RepID=UPI003FCFF9D0